MFNNGASGFKDRDLYVLCANASDGTITASPHNNGSKLTAFSPGQTVMQTATEEKVREITYWWPRPGSVKPLSRISLILWAARLRIPTAATSSFSIRVSESATRNFIPASGVLRQNAEGKRQPDCQFYFSIAGHPIGWECNRWSFDRTGAGTSSPVRLAPHF
jgi:hypothetical protein